MSLIENGNQNGMLKSQNLVNKVAVWYIFLSPSSSFKELIRHKYKIKSSHYLDETPNYFGKGGNYH